MNGASNGRDVVNDAAGNMTTIPDPRSLTSDLSLKYDAWNRMVEVKDGANTVHSNEYDGLGRRIVRSVYVSGSLDHRIHYYYYQQGLTPKTNLRNLTATTLLEA